MADKMSSVVTGLQRHLARSATSSSGIRPSSERSRTRARTAMSAGPSRRATFRPGLTARPGLSLRPSGECSAWRYLTRPGNCLLGRANLTCIYPSLPSRPSFPSHLPTLARLSRALPSLARPSRAHLSFARPFPWTAHRAPLPHRAPPPHRALRSRRCLCRFPRPPWTPRRLHRHLPTRWLSPQRPSFSSPLVTGTAAGRCWR